MTIFIVMTSFVVFLFSNRTCPHKKLHEIQCHFREVPHAVRAYRLRRRPRARPRQFRAYPQSYLSFAPPSALRQKSHIDNMLPWRALKANQNPAQSLRIYLSPRPLPAIKLSDFLAELHRSISYSYQGQDYT